MGLTVAPLSQKGNDEMIADRRLWATADWSTLVEDGGPGAAFLVAAGSGATIPSQIVSGMGLALRDGKVQQVPKGDIAPPPAPKEVEPKPNKARKPAANKRKKAAAKE